MFQKNKLMQRVDKTANIKEENSRAWSKEAIDTLFNCFQSPVTWMITSYQQYYKDQNRKKSLLLEEFDMLVQEYNINRYDYKKWNNTGGQFLLFS